MRTPVTSRRPPAGSATTSRLRAGQAFATAQSVFLTSHFEALRPRWLESTHRLGTAYLHGRPGTEGYPEFDRAFEALRSAPERFSRIQVTHGEMRDLVLGAGVEPQAVHLIPIGIDLENFPLKTPERAPRREPRSAFPRDAFVVGSFQKDGVGWGEGLEPKLIKGPDVLVAALVAVRAAVPELHVLLTGPARGYVRRELERPGIPYEHVRVGTREELGAVYHAVDVCLVAPGRREGRSPCSSRWRPALRSSRPGSARRPSSWRTDRTAGSWTSRTRRAWPTARSRSMQVVPSRPRQRPRDGRALRARAPGHAVGNAPRRIRGAPAPVSIRSQVPRAARAARRRVPRRPFRLVMPLWFWRPLSRLWLSALRADPDRRRAVRELLVTYDDVYRELDLAAIAYEEGVHPKHRLTRYHDFFVERVRPGELVLDIGSGKGELAHDLVVRGGTRVLGIDNDPSHLAFARSHFVHEGLEFRAGDALEEPPPGHFDVIVLSNVLEHLSPRVEFLSRITCPPARGRSWSECRCTSAIGRFR